MGLSGFILELLVPGLITAIGAALLAVELEIWSASNATGVEATVLVSAVLVISYLIGITIRHATYRLVPSSGAYYHERLLTKWDWTIPGLRRRYLVEERGTESPTAEDLGIAEANEIISRMAADHLGRMTDAWGEYLLYQRNIARVSLNSIVPMSIVALACFVGFVHRAVGAQVVAAVSYLAALVGAGLLIVGLRVTNHTRRHWYVDLLVRTHITAADDD